MWLNSLRLKIILPSPPPRQPDTNFIVIHKTLLTWSNTNFLKILSAADSQRPKEEYIAINWICHCTIQTKICLYYLNSKTQQSNSTPDSVSNKPLQNSGAVVSCHWLGPFSYMQLNGILCYYLFLYTCLCFAWKKYK